MGDLSFLAIFLASVCLLSFGLAWWLTRKFGRMARRKIILLAPLPLPAVVFVLGLYLIISVSMTSREDCGVDACGMAIAIVMAGYTVALIAYVLGMATAEVAYRMVKSRT